MLNKVKLALRISNTAYDAEITDLINACKKELELAGIASSNIVYTDGIIIQTIISYCKAYFGYDNPDAERYIRSYESLKSFLCLNYNVPITQDEESTEPTVEEPTEEPVETQTNNEEE